MKLWKSSKSNKPLAVLFILLFASIGTILVFRSHAAGPYASLEPEQGTLSAPASLVSDGTASGGQAVQFGTGPVQPANWYVSPSGSGTSCTQASPCGDINTAYQKASQGDVIGMTPGTYGAQKISYRPAADTFTSNVVVRPASGTVTITGFTGIESAHITLKQLNFTENVSFGATVDGTQKGNYDVLDGVSITKTSSTDAVSVMGSVGVQIINSIIRPGIYNANAISMFADGSPGGTQKIPTDTLIQNNEIGPAWASTDWQALGVHNQSIHVQGSTRTTIRQNLIWEGGSTGAMDIDSNNAPEIGILVENNYIAGCGLRTPPTGAVCDAFHAFQFGDDYPNPSPQDIIVRNNTVKGDILDSKYVQVGIPTGDLGDNITEGGTECSGVYSHGNLVGASSFGDCSRDIIGVPIYTTPSFGGLNWGIVSNSPGYGKGVLAGQGYSP